MQTHATTHTYAYIYSALHTHTQPCTHNPIGCAILITHNPSRVSHMYCMLLHMYCLMSCEYCPHGHPHSHSAAGTAPPRSSRERCEPCWTSSPVGVPHEISGTCVTHDTRVTSDECVISDMQQQGVTRHIHKWGRAVTGAIVTNVSHSETPIIHCTRCSFAPSFPHTLSLTHLTQAVKLRHHQAHQPPVL